MLIFSKSCFGYTEAMECQITELLPYICSLWELHSKWGLELYFQCHCGFVELWNWGCEGPKVWWLTWLKICSIPNEYEDCLLKASVDLWSCGTVETGAWSLMAYTINALQLPNDYESYLLNAIVDLRSCGNWGPKGWWLTWLMFCSFSTVMRVVLPMSVWICGAVNCGAVETGLK